MAKFLTNASGATWWPNFFLIQVTPPGGTVHGEQEKNFKLVIHGQKRKEPNGHSSGKWRKVTTTSTCLSQRATVWCDQRELPTVKPAKLKCSRDLLLDLAMQWNTNTSVVTQTSRIRERIIWISLLFQLISLFVPFPVETAILTCDSRLSSAS